jgi:hypothetical protein
MQETLIVHAIGAPIGFVLISLVYFTRFGYTSPLRTASLFLAVVASLDVVVVAVLIEQSFAMFANPLGTWLPLVLIFAATYLTGVVVLRTRRPVRRGALAADDPQRRPARSNAA